MTPIKELEAQMEQEITFVSSHTDFSSSISRDEFKKFWKTQWIERAKLLGFTQRFLAYLTAL